MIASLAQRCEGWYRQLSLPRGAVPLQQKATHLCRRIFAALNHFCGHLAGVLKDRIWPYNRALEKGSDQFWVEKVCAAAAERFREEEEKKQLPVHMLDQNLAPVLSDTATLLIGTSPAISAWMSCQSDAGLCTTLYTAQCVHNLFLHSFLPLAHYSSLEAWGLLPERNQANDQITQLSRLAVSAALAQAVDWLSMGCAGRVARFSAVLMLTSPPVEKALGNTYAIKWLNERVRQGHDGLRQVVVERCSPPLTHYLLSKIQQTARATTVMMGGAQSPVAVVQPGNWLERCVQPFVEHMGQEIAGTALEASARKTAETLVGFCLFDGPITVLSDAIQGACFNRTFYANCALHPKLAAITFICAGGPQQTVKDLCLRTLGGLFLYSTGSFLGASLIVYTPKVVEYMLTLSGKYKRKHGIQDRLISEVCQSYLYAISDFASKRLTAPRSPQEGVDPIRPHLPTIPAPAWPPINRGAPSSTSAIWGNRAAKWSVFFSDTIKPLPATPFSTRTPPNRASAYPLWGRSSGFSVPVKQEVFGPYSWDLNRGLETALPRTQQPDCGYVE